LWLSFRNKERTARLCFVGRPLRSSGKQFSIPYIRKRDVAVVRDVPLSGIQFKDTKWHNMKPSRSLNSSKQRFTGHEVSMFHSAR
jgi:hypothetical protein